jgi:transcription elongation factor Elf1
MGKMKKKCRGTIKDLKTEDDKIVQCIFCLKYPTLKLGSFHCKNEQET